MHKHILYPEGACSHIVCTVLAVKKKTHRQGTGGGSPKADLTPAEDIALQLNKGRPVLEGIPGGTETSISPSQDATRFIQGIFFHLYMGHSHIHNESIWTV